MKSKIVIYALLFLPLSDLTFSQQPPLKKSDDSINARQNEKITNLEMKIQKLDSVLDNNLTISRSLYNMHKQETITLLNTYVGIVIVAVTGIAALFGFFGWSEIKKKVGKIVTAKAEKEVQKLLADIEKKGNETIDSIKAKGDDIINSLLVEPKQLNLKIKTKSITDNQINNLSKNIQAQELFTLAFNSKDPIVQIELYKSVIEIEPKHFIAYNNLGVTYNNINKPKEALKVLDIAIKISPEFPLAYVNRAYALNQLNELDKAMENVNKAIELNEKLDGAYSVKGNILTKLGKLKEAESLLNKAVDLNPKSPEAYFNRGFFYEERGEFEKSLKDYEHAESLGFSNKAKLYNNLAVLYRRQKKFDEAKNFVEKARAIDSNLANIDGTLALIYADLGKDELFYKYLKIALEKGCPAWNYLSDPGFEKYRNSERLKQLFEPFKKKYY